MSVVQAEPSQESVVAKFAVFDAPPNIIEFVYKPAAPPEDAATGMSVVSVQLEPSQDSTFAVTFGFAPPAAKAAVAIPVL